jgi:hypothetical protein
MEADNGIEARGQLEWLVAAYLVVVTREAMTGWKGSDQARGIHTGAAEAIVGKQKQRPL